MVDRGLAAALRRTYLHTVTAFRPLAEGGEARVWEDVPCALSRSAHTTAPAPPERMAAVPEAAFRLTLYTEPQVVFRLGDRVEVTDGTGRVWHGRTSDSFAYPSHCVTVVEITEALAG